MTYKINIAPTGRGFHFNPDGDNILSGLSLENAVETPTQAIALANALIPPLSAFNRAAISSAADGVYSTALVLPSNVTYRCEGTSIITSDLINITSGDSQETHWGSLLNFSSGCTLYKIDGNSRVNASINSMVIGTAGASNCTGFEVSGSCFNIFTRVLAATLAGDGATLIRHTATSITPFDYNVESLLFTDINETLIDFNPPTAFDQAAVNLTTAQEDPTETTTNSMIIKARAGRLIVRAEVLSADSICAVESGAELSLNTQIGLGTVLVEDGGEMVLDAGILVGDITVETGGLLNVSVKQHIGAVLGGGVINGCINGEPYGNAQEQTILMGSDFTSQTPTGTDAPLQITFGAAQGTVSDPVMLSAAGALTANKKKKYQVDVSVQYHRDNAGQAAWLFFRVKLNGEQLGDSIFAKLDDANDDLPVLFSSRLKIDADLAVGDVLTFEIMRDSQGFNDGGLVSTTPTPGDWSPAPSASLKVSI